MQVQDEDGPHVAYQCEYADNQSGDSVDVSVAMTGACIYLEHAAHVQGAARFEGYPYPSTPQTAKTE